MKLFRLLVGFIFCSVGERGLSAVVDEPALATRATAALVAALQEEDAWIKVHAAEALIFEGRPESVWTMLAGVPEQGGGPWPRVGLWRIRTRLSANASERAHWLGLVEAVFLDPAHPPDRLQALETLCKVQAVMRGVGLETIRRMTREAPETERPMAWWALTIAGDENALSQLTACLRSKEPIARMRAAYALRWLQTTDPVVLRALARAADAEQAHSIAQPYLVSSAFALAAAPESMASWRKQLEQRAATGEPGVRLEACQALMLHPADADWARWTSAFAEKGDSRIGPAWLVLHQLNYP
jgi:hypothetical protein